MLRRLPIESTGPMQLFAATRVAAALIALIAIVALGLSDDTQEALVIGGLALPWTVAVLVVARRRPDFALSPVVPAVDFALLVLLEVVAPETLGAVRVTALFLIAAHAHFQGERRGLAVAAFGSLSLVIATQIRGDEPVTGNLLVFYEVAFVLSALATPWSWGCCAPPSPLRGCVPRACRDGRSRPKARRVAGWRNRSTTAPCRS